MTTMHATLIADKNTEMALLGKAIVNSDALESLIEIGEDAFYFDKHREVYRAIHDLHREGEAVDMLTLMNRLIERGKLDKLGGEGYLASLMNSYSFLDVRSAIRTLRKFEDRRKLSELTMQMYEMVQQPGVDNRDIVKQIEDTITDIERINREEFIAVEELFRSGNIAADFDVSGKFVPTGFSAIDSRMIGLFNGEFIVLAARPGCGKTALALNIASNIARNNNVLFISLEMSTKQLALRLLSADTQIDSDMIRRGKLPQKFVDQIQHAGSHLSDLNLTFLERIYSLDSIVAKIRKFAQQKRLGAVVIDYLQLIQVKSNAQRYVQIGEISRRLKVLAGERDVPLLCLAQLSRNAENNVPKLSDLRESGDIEQDADVVMFIHKDPKEKGDKVNILYAKNRTGKADNMSEMLFKKKFTRFYDIDNVHEGMQ